MALTQCYWYCKEIMLIFQVTNDGNMNLSLFTYYVRVILCLGLIAFCCLNLLALYQAMNLLQEMKVLELDLYTQTDILLQFTSYPNTLSQYDLEIYMRMYLGLAIIAILLLIKTIKIPHREQNQS